LRLRGSLHPRRASGVLPRNDAKLLASLIPGVAVLLCESKPPDSKYKKPRSLSGVCVLGALMPFAELRAVQSAKSQTIGFLKARFHCTTSHGIAPLEECIVRMP
jgi:hypothetical protein